MSLEKHLAELSDDSKPLKHAWVARFSSLIHDELDQFKRAWPLLSLERRRQVLAYMVEMVEDNADLDFNAIFRISLSDPDSQIREQGVSGLWECDDRTTIAPLTEHLMRDSSEKVRAAAAVALGKFALLAQQGKLISRDGARIEKALLSVLDSPTEVDEVKRRALEAVAVFQSPRVAELIGWAYHSNEHKLRCSAVYAMGRSCDPRWLPVVLKELSNNDSEMRYEAACAFGEMGEEAVMVVPYLLPLLKDDDLDVQLATIRSLGSIGGAHATRALKLCLKSSDEALRDAAEDALRNLEAEEDPLAFKFDL